MSHRLALISQFRGWTLRASLMLLVAFPSAGIDLCAKTVTLTVTDNNTSISLIEGDTLVVTLPSPIADSYRWQLLLPRPSPLTEISDDTSAAKANGAGAQTFRFNASSVSEGLLLLRFERPKNGLAPAVAQTYSVDVAVASGAPASGVPIGIYKGTTACADCTGIQTELRLYVKGKNDFTDSIYVSTRTYLGGRGGSQSFTDRGAWGLMRGDAVNPDATVYALNFNQPEQIQYFLLQPGGATLTQLDKQMKPVNAPPMYELTLKRVD